MPALRALCLQCQDITPLPITAQALQYLRKLCAHPLLVLDSSVPSHAAAVAACAPAAAPDQDWRAADSPLRALHHAPKLQALRQLLQVRTSYGHVMQGDTH